MFSAFGATKRYLATNPDGSTRILTTADFYKVCSTSHYLRVQCKVIPYC